MTLTANTLYELLPAVYRDRDARIAAATGAAGPLRALVGLIAEQVQVLEDSLERAYDDQFIETCAEWVVPYIADLVGVRGLAEFPNAPFTLRAEVANAIGDRRRKGTISGLEDVARHLTGWSVNAVEYFELLATTQYMAHLRPRNLAVADVRNANWPRDPGSPEIRSGGWRRIGTPFDPVARTADVRNIESGRGRYDIPHIGIFVWRIPSQQMEDVPPFRVDERRFSFDALGRDIRLHTLVADLAPDRAGPLDVPAPIGRRAMAAALDAYYGRDKSVFVGFEKADEGEIPVCVCDLSDVRDATGQVTGWAHAPQDALGIDPELGRIAFPAGRLPPAAVRVTYCYGFSFPMGGGQYQRALPPPSDAPITISVPGDFATVQAALEAAMHRLSSGDHAVHAVVEIADSDPRAETLAVTVPEGCRIDLRAKDQERALLVLAGDLVARGGDGSAFGLDGLLLAGSVSVPALLAPDAPNLLGTLELVHCTLPPGPIPAMLGVAAQPEGVRLSIDSAAVAVSIDRSILGPIRAIEDSSVTIANSIVDAGGRGEIAFAALDGEGPGAVLTARNTTFVGKVHTQKVALASGVIFAAQSGSEDSLPGPVAAEQLQEGCVRFSYVPPGSRVPRRYRCQPPADDASSGAPVFASPPADFPSSVAPVFTSLRFGDPGYAQLADASGPGITQGAEDGSEMGAFHDLYQPRREANLKARLRDWLRFGMQAGVFHAS